MPTGLTIFILYEVAILVVSYFVIFHTHDHITINLTNEIPAQDGVSKEILDKLNELIVNSIREDLIIIDDETGFFVYDKRKDSYTALDREKFKNLFVK
jgi:archaellum biogenesis ATPase FlaH